MRLSNLQHSWGFVSGSPFLSRQLYGGGINRDMMEVFMSWGSIVINFRGRHGSCRLVHHQRLERVTPAAPQVGLGEAFGYLSMEAIPSCGVPITLKTTWDTMSKIKKREVVASNEVSVKYRKRDNESFSAGGLLPQKESFLNRSTVRVQYI